MSTVSHRSAEESEEGREPKSQRRYRLLGIIAISVLLVFGILSLTSDLIFSSTTEVAGKISTVQRIESSGSHIRVSHGADLNPKEGENFILMAWFKFRRLPEDGESITLLSKVDSFLRSQRGYRLSLTREAGRIRPVVYWRNGEAVGGTYKFSPFELRHHQWAMFGLSFSEGRYLGLHAVMRVPGRKPEVILLGGYTLSTPVYPDATADLYAGSFSGPPYRGFLGPMSIISLKKRRDSLYRIFKQAGIEGVPPTELFTDGEVKLYIDEARSDKSSLKNLVTFSSDLRSPREKDEDENKGAEAAGAEEAAPVARPATAIPPPAVSPSTVPPRATQKAKPKTAKGHTASQKAVKKIPSAPVKKSSHKRKKTDA